jgi:phospholipase/carboxylesterase
MRETTMTAMIDGPRRDAAAGKADALVILLHGYGADGADLFGLAEPLSTVLPTAAFVSPNAPERCSVNPMGYQWFPIPRMDGSTEEAMRAGFDHAQKTLNAFIDGEMLRYGLPADRVALVGFSQGSMMSLHVAPRRADPLAGIVAFSGRLLEPERLSTETVSRPPVLLVHGDMDDVVPPSSLEDARAGLGAAGFTVRWHVSRGIGHGIAPDGLQMAAQFLVGVLGRGED